jgi:hypothetical protein
MILGAVMPSDASTWLLSLPTWGDVEGLACSLHHPTSCGWQTRELCYLKGAITTHRSAVDDGLFLGVRSSQA